MKKYLIADALSLTEIIMGLTLLVMTAVHAPADWAIWVFVAGELCDAFDGICARRWPYPDDGKLRWWRIPKVVQAIEHSSDILIIGALAFYLIAQSNPVVHYSTLFAGIAITVFCIWTETVIKFLRFQPPLTIDQCRMLIRRRRYVYLLGIAIGVTELIFCTSWPPALKLILCFVGIAIGLALVIVKWDRFTESHETFREFLRRHASRK